MKRPLLATFAATAALLVWGMLFWGFLYEPAGVYNTLPHDSVIADALVEAGVQTGTYFYPWPRNTPEAMAAFLEGHKAGPFFKLSYVAEGIDPQSPMKMLWGSLHHLIVAALGAALLHVAQIPSAARRAIVIVLAGLIGTTYIQLADPIWYHLPWDYPRGVFAYELISWVLMGVVLGTVMKTDEET